MSTAVNQLYPKLSDKSYYNSKFIGCTFGSNKLKCCMYRVRFISCTFENCYLLIDAAYCDFIGCTFLNCKFGNRSNYSLLYKCNMDNSTMDIVSYTKFKRCSMNGSIIGKSRFNLFIKCSDTYLTIMNNKDSIKVTHTNKKVVKMNATKIPTIRVANGGTTKSLNLHVESTK